MVAGVALALEKRWRGCTTAQITIRWSAQGTDFKNKIKTEMFCCVIKSGPPWGRSVTVTEACVDDLALAVELGCFGESVRRTFARLMPAQRMDGDVVAFGSLP
jgi:hypothetical protein